jgi:hypothetical protein
MTHVVEGTCLMGKGGCCQRVECHTTVVFCFLCGAEATHLCMPVVILQA